MKNKLILIMTVGLVIASPLAQAQTKTTYRDNMGRIQGTKK